MEKIKKVAVIGGTGKSGKYLVKQLIHRQIPIKILVRNPDHFQLKDHLDESPFIEVVQGDLVGFQLDRAVAAATERIRAIELVDRDRQPGVHRVLCTSRSSKARRRLSILPDSRARWITAS